MQAPKRKILILDKEMQNRLISYSILNGLIFGLVLTCIAAYVSMQSTTMGADADIADLRCMVRMYEQGLHWAILIGCSLIVGLVWTGVAALYFSHRLAGPVFQMKKKLRAHIDGAPMQKISLRKDDYFGELADLINKAMVKDSSDTNPPA